MMDLPDWQFGFALIPRTALRPHQEPYFAAFSATINPNSGAIFVIGKGFSVDEEWVPPGKRFSIWNAFFSIDNNSLIETRIGVEFAANPGSITWLAGKFGYGYAEYYSGIFFDYNPNSRPVYYIWNFNDVAVTLDFTIFGVVEVIV